MDDEVTWGFLCLIWVVAVSIPYMYGVALTSAGKKDASDRISERIGGPWTIGFIGLMGIWASGAYAAAGISYTALAVSLFAIWNLWLRKQRNRRLADGSANEATNSKKTDQMLLTLPQRLVAVSVATVIAIMLFVQIDEEGLGSSPWIFGLLVIAALLVVALAPRRGE